MNLPKTQDGSTHRKVFIIEGNPSVAERLLAALVTPQNEGTTIAFATQHLDCSIVDSQRAFYETDPAKWDLIITASNLSDGSGFDVLSYVQGLRPDVPVILTGTPEESDAAVEAIRAGAADYLMLTGHEMITFPSQFKNV